MIIGPIMATPRRFGHNVVPSTDDKMPQPGLAALESYHHGKKKEVLD